MIRFIYGPLDDVAEILEVFLGFFKSISSMTLWYLTQGSSCYVIVDDLLALFDFLLEVKLGLGPDSDGDILRTLHVECSNCGGA